MNTVCFPGINMKIFLYNTTTTTTTTTNNNNAATMT
jgi:hypothetical protein